ncbi:hypothetical protein HNP99_000093 [Flavobacterium sp. 28A]|uniref:hypothetical protein n=1 Tax=Flavobacterium sp. 28A TaxID=2735895 RepID=UPI0015707B7D|nr:hypothetical protein [Flavobacterium sp. 28A]NRT13768.1 hypothetical protein [Flavobacterium sp. 28A]
MLLLLTSCQKHNIYFDTKTQKVISCNDIPISSFSIENDSIKPDGFPYEAAMLFKWEGNVHLIPSSFSFDSIPKEYISTKGGLIYKSKVKLNPNCRYTIEKSGNGLSPCIIKIWINSKGYVYKTTHPVCIKNEGVPKEWINK